MKNIWEIEPKIMEFDHTGMKCIILRMPRLLHLCGYVGLLPEHPLYGKDYNFRAVSRLEVHGGITYCGSHPNGISHTLWWIGFDCAHAGDLCPGNDMKRSTEFYKDIHYVKHETEQLAEQLAKMMVTK